MVKIKIETVSQLSELKIASIEDLIKKVADFVGFNVVPTPIDIFGSEVGQPLIKAGLDTVEKIANAEIITIARILPEFSFNKVMEIIQQANDFYIKMANGESEMDKASAQLLGNTNDRQKAIIERRSRGN